MNHDELMQMILDHYDNPRNYGVISDASVTQGGGNPSCDDQIIIYMKIGKDGVINDISFEGEGCMISMAGTSILLDKIKSANVSEIEEATPQLIFDLFGKKIVKTRPRCAHLALNTLKVSVKKWRDAQLLAGIKSGTT